MTTTQTEKTKTTGEAGKLGRRTLRKLGRDKRHAKIHSDKEFAAKLFEGKSKRSADKKVAFRKKKLKK